MPPHADLLPGTLDVLVLKAAARLARRYWATGDLVVQRQGEKT